ncbi:hypothetical protein DYQ86_01930 [Acidobacteria bacterium AB60]|nr:hypothetical protein DYQ86_01930 [Acidobacteria bacterium AB60]
MRPTPYLLSALLACALLQAQTVDAQQAQPPSLSTPLPVPGGGAGLGPGGIPEPADRPAPTKEETLQKAKAQSDQIADMQARRIAQQLNLNQNQLARVRAILIGREDELRKAFSPDAPGAKDHPLTAQERQLKIQQVHDATMKRIEAVLNPQQKQQFDAMLERMRTDRAHRAGMAAARQRHVIGAGSPASAPTTHAPDSAPAAPTSAPDTAPAASAPPPSR